MPRIGMASCYGLRLSRDGGQPAQSLRHLDFTARAVPQPEECIFLNRAKRLLMPRPDGLGH